MRKTTSRIRHSHQTQDHARRVRAMKKTLRRQPARFFVAAPKGNQWCPYLSYRAPDQQIAWLARHRLPAAVLGQEQCVWPGLPELTIDHLGGAGWLQLPSPLVRLTL